MYQQKKAVLQRVFFAADLAATVIAFFLAYQIKTTWFPGALGVLYPAGRYAGLFLLILPLWAFFLSRARIYESWVEHPLSWILRMAKNLCYGFLLLILFLFVFRIQFVSRILLFLFLLVDFLLLVFIHGSVHLVYRLRTHKNRPRVILVGYPEKVRAFLDKLREDKNVSLEISSVYFLGDAVKRRAVPLREAWLPSETGIVPSVEEIPHGIHEKVIDEILFAVRPEDLSQIQDILTMAEEEGIVSRILADVFDLKLSKASWDQLGGFSMITFSRVPMRAGEYLFKSVMDVSVALLALILTSPLFALLAMLVKQSSPGPVFFRQKRVGLRGRVFTLLKFRTMVQGADTMRDELMPENELSGPAFKMQNDPRITSLGKFLRRHSMDELPQLLNVLAGHMSLVGPRPALPEEVAQYQPWQRRRLSMRPGITGLWQVSGRDKRDFNDWVALDLDYIDRWSSTLDLRILGKTLPQVLFGKGV